MEVLCIPSEDCPHYQEGCYEDTHHIWFPRSEYQTKVEKKFRRLSCNVIRICRAVHDDLHAESPYGPTKPPRSFMIAEINRIEGVGNV